MGQAPRDSEALRRVMTISREFSELLTGPVFRPHVPYSLHSGVYVSEFASEPVEGPGTRTIWNVVNRNGGALGDRDGDVLRVPCLEGTQVAYYDLYHGHAWPASDQPRCVAGFALIRFNLEALGYGSILRIQAGSGAIEPSAEFLETMRSLTRSELRTFSNQWSFLKGAILPNPPTNIPTNPTQPPPNMVRLRRGLLVHSRLY